MNIKIIVATHKKYKIPIDPMYFPLFVGKEGKQDIGMVGDDSGDNISSLNSRFCELTGIYWVWKNLVADCVGLVHYRRHFTVLPVWQRLGRDKCNCVLTQSELEPLLEKYDIILPKQRRYYIESIYSHFVHLPYTFEKDIQILRETIKDIAPEYLESFDTVMNRSHAHMFNMFIMKWKRFNEYCAWMFPIILEVDKRIDVSSYTPMEARAVAYFGEFMLDIWNEKQKIPYKELSVMFMEKRNWFVKGGRFLLRKILPQK